VFITFEGPEGAGKTTQVNLLAEALRADGRRVVATHEPGGTVLGEDIRRILLAPGGTISPRAEALLFVAARSQLVDEVIRPALARGEIVLCDRFSDSTIAYQAGGRGLARDAIESLITFATGGLEPDLTFLLDLAAAAGLNRKHGGSRTRLDLENLAFHERVRVMYLDLARRFPDRIVVIDAARPIDDIARQIQAITRERLAARAGGERPR